ncbi:hypothetical protein CY34DRAFT_17510 [Suillus luteus UH-Slu-Lm8-n1]|uniref:Uncharacterized protein n=1 Tax=Suillus luteus UH-Slu-Lm8-n1 TaxID=930992 RepID=A0A0C9ZB22_9AGAM|nr:hypothetical protein CY34DRAFT_17510 [Suillus luteus UH-Slu-Lm8-n1]
MSSGGGQSSRSPSHGDQLLRPWANTGASQAGSTRNRSVTPDPGSGRSSNYLSIGGHGSNSSHPQGSCSTSGEVVIPKVVIQPPSSPTLLLDEPISAGVCQCRDSGPSTHGVPTKLTPQLTKHLKMHAKKACEENDVLQEEVMTFIDSGDIFYMLIDLRITLVKLCEGNKDKRMQELKDSLESKDFENGLYNCLFACMLLPNITVYVTDTQSHIMEFISKNREIFKIPPGVLNDVELRAQLGKAVTKLLTNIRSAIKAALTTSIIKRTSIADNCTAPTPSVDFFIGVSDYKTASIEDLFAAYLIPSLKQDLRDKVACGLSVNIGQLKEDLFDADLDGTNSSQAPMQANVPHVPSARAGENVADMGDEGLVDQNGAEQDDLDANEEDGSSNAHSGANSANGVVLPPDNPLNSGFRLIEGMPAQIADESSSIVTEQEKELQKLFTEVFQADLAKFPGGKKASKLISKTNPGWQTTIQTGLIW